MTLQSFENWLGNAFYDLCFASYIQNELHETGFFTEFKCFYCLQALEKVLKSFLIYKSRITTVGEAKRHSHHISRLIQEVLNAANIPDLKISICDISSEYYKKLYGYKGDFLLSETNVSNQCESNVQQWCDSHLVEQVKWYFYLLEQSYFEVRYPYEIPLPGDYSGGLLHDRDMEYLNVSILVTTIKLFKLFLSLFDKNNYEPLLQYTYSYQKDSYDEMTKKTKEILERNEELYMYLIGKNSKYEINSFVSIN
ncbi:TPA: hypothetical protein JBA38_11885 [Legionella pneumophila]|uniref:hypothetical protein n=1 Tax=Legionella pneumophila TaxID=446 RepID=UPI001374CF48|nr:hypothetical protein [Legionella pneumophila]HAT2147256.1 hypothetical protein [Legionella pneumophila]HAT2150360.1 hypothetical protein [Legionella pneumophila]HAT8730741.1 hypothetical protein [Legionella pneumophila]HAT8752386.1 hypothetical protein [Legionella pneumophila]HCC0305304.1 hypothetical protein [Legionella pneumophila]